tara:strand:+ start:273 stop:572 length:300 start_codon:yes stop_codon:yes gene_type:complete
MSDYILKAKNKGKKKRVSKKLDSRTNTIIKSKRKYAKSKSGGYVSGPGTKTTSKKVTDKRAARVKKRAQNKPLKRKLSTVGQRVKRGVKRIVRKIKRKK